MTFPKYPEYKDSGIEWLGEVPAHWCVSPFKWQIEANDSGAWGDDPVGDNDTYVLRSTDQTVDGHWRIAEPAIRHLGLKERVSTLLESGDLVITKSSGSSLHIGKTTLVTELIASKAFAFGNFMQRIRTKPSFNPKLAWYVLNSNIARLQLDLLSNSTTGLANLNGTIIGEILVATPPSAEQAAIVSFLDHEIARIDALIEEQKRLIKLLKEKRQAVISHAVTKGLDPDVPMKDSGVEWIGQAPAHWEIIRIKYAAKLESGHTPNKERPEYWSGCIQWVSLNDSKKLAKVDYIEATKYQISERGIANSSARLLPAGTVVFTRDATIGLAAITSREMAVSQHLIAWIVRDAILSPEFLLLVFYAMEKELGRYTFGATLKTIRMPDVRSLTMPLPTLSEQFDIVSCASNERNRLQKLIDEARLAADLLSERRSALISAAVTGKIDVRNWEMRAEAEAESYAMAAEPKAGYKANSP